MGKKNLYDELVVKKNATEEEIKSAYREKAKDVHPDKPGGSHEKMQALVHAYDILKNKTSRHRYDKTGSEENTPFDVRFRNEISSIFISLVNSAPHDRVLKHDLIKMVRVIFNNKIADVEKSRKENQKDIDKFKSVLERTIDNGVLTGAIKNAIYDFELKEGFFEEDIKFFRECLKVISDFKFRFDEKPEPELDPERYGFTRISYNNF